MVGMHVCMCLSVFTNEKVYADHQDFRNLIVQIVFDCYDLFEPKAKG